MRKAFEWLYRELDSGRTRRSAIRRASFCLRTKKAVKASFKQLDKLAGFDTSHPCNGTRILGMDEVGRGPLAGPLVAVCVQLPYPTYPDLPFLRDSKMLQADEREFLAERIERVALKVSYGVVEACEFGKDLNLHQLTFLAMRRALEKFEPDPERPHLLVDGKFPVPHWRFSQRAVIKGDDTSLSIAAASVLAKVRRDSFMRALDADYPAYGFKNHVGYATEAHQKALLEHGPCPQHRTNFLHRVFDRQLSLFPDDFACTIMNEEDGGGVSGRSPRVEGSPQC